MSEYRAGFVRCATCGVDLVEALDGSEHEAPRTVSHGHYDVAAEAALYPFCGFLTLEDARSAREELRSAGIHSDILIRESGAPDALEEFWIRVPRQRFADVADLLHEEAAVESDEGNGDLSEGAGAGETFACSECGRDVDAEADACPHCGARFDE
jgi:rubrerythrin